MPRQRKNTAAAATAAVKEEAQEERGGNAYLQQFTDVRKMSLPDSLGSAQTKRYLS
jgi:septal ring factor EnvC (AmiA/AmiB activator)